MGKLEKKIKQIVKREEISVGYKCNIKCRFCFYGCSPENSLKPIEKIKKDILLSKGYGIEHIELSGGEPMMHKDIESIIEFCRNQGFKTICMITNGTLLKNRERMYSLQKKGLNQFVFSLHGAQSPTHDYLTGGQTFHDMLQAIDNAKILEIPFRINVVVTSKNFKELADIARLIRTMRPLMVNYLVYSPLGFSKNFVFNMAAQYSDISLRMAEAVDLVKDYMKVRVRYIPFCLISGYEAYVCNVHQLHYDPYEWDYVVREHMHNGLFYKWAKIFVGLFYVPLRRIIGQKIYNSFHEAIIKAICLVNSYKPLKCRVCKYYFICDGLWKEYAAKYGAKELKPLRGKRIIDPASLMIDYN
jgi:MoaA/NifB/PqqE/SkfB family radical SAM enzyme